LTRSPIAPGPIDLDPAPATLAAWVVTPGAEPRVHGYDVESDLARHYGFHETVFLALTGELPAEGVGPALAVAATFAAPLSVAEAPAHAAVLLQVCGTQPRSVVATAGVALAEQAQQMVDDHRPFLAWLGAPQGPPPAVAHGDEADRAAVRRLGEALHGMPLAVPALGLGLSRTAAVLAVLHACGLSRPDALVAFWVWARLPFAAAEGLAWKAGAIRDYPVRLPRFRYEEEDR
jgi:hypothetical protein